MQQQTVPEPDQTQVQVFRYRTSFKQLRLLCLVMALMALIGLITLFTAAREPIEFLLFTLPPPWTYLVWMLCALAGAWLSVKTWQHMEGLKGRWLNLTVGKDRLLLVDPEKNTSDLLVLLKEVKWFRIVESRNGRTLEIRDPNQKWALSSEDMASREEFDSFANLLREKLGPDKERH